MAEPAVAEPRAPQAYPPTAVLTRQQVAEWLQVDLKKLDALPIRRRKLGGRTVRYLAQWVIEFLEREAA